MLEERPILQADRCADGRRSSRLAGPRVRVAAYARSPRAMDARTRGPPARGNQHQAPDLLKWGQHPGPDGGVGCEDGDRLGSHAPCPPRCGSLIACPAARPHQYECRGWSGGISVLVDESATAGRSNDLEVPTWLVCSVGCDGWKLVE